MTEILKLNPLEPWKKQMVSTLTSGLREKMTWKYKFREEGNSTAVLGFQIYQRRVRRKGGQKHDSGIWLSRFIVVHNFCPL